MGMPTTRHLFAHIKAEMRNLDFESRCTENNVSFSIQTLHITLLHIRFVIFIKRLRGVQVSIYV